MPRFRRLTASLLLACLPAVAFAAPPPKDATPEQVATEAYARMKAGDWQGAAETFDPAALARFRAMMQPVIDAAAKPAPASDDGTVAIDTSGMVLAMLFSPATSIDEVRALSDAEFMGRVMKNMTGMGKVQLDRQTLLGAVPEGPDVVHLVARAQASADGVAMTQMEVITLNRTPDGWRLAMSGDMSGLAEALGARMDGGAEGAAAPAAPDEPPAPKR